MQQGFGFLVCNFWYSHAVRPVNTDQQLDWDTDAGKWSIVLELRETYAKFKCHNDTAFGKVGRKLSH